ncbi:MAG: 1,4-alpha-glucan branching protein GlgB [Candidatus Melainabacteria bacterium]|nr:1,4-alpha-glucan branching protein GlgB [Candidatus Melainabacteria bacterium]
MRTPSRWQQLIKQPSTESSFISDFDLHLFNEGTYNRIYERLGAHLTRVDGKDGTHFAVWAPNATSVSVVGDFNSWDGNKNRMEPVKQSGIWACFIPGLGEGEIYKYLVENTSVGFLEQKTDPVAFFSEERPKTASVIYDLDKYKWGDADWLEKRLKRNGLDAPVSMYEVHLGSWMTVPEEGNRWLTYHELAQKLVPYVKRMGYTHVELLPIMEHPLDASWGYQPTGYFAATSRFGDPEGLMHLIDKFHQADIGVILDWVPAHFPRDGHGLGRFDGTHLYEHADPRQGQHIEWGTYIFNYGRHEVKNFLVSNALFWMDKYHIDGLRVDAVASMLYLDYARKDGEWIANEYGGKENIPAIEFLRRLNETVYTEFPSAMMVAEESTSWGLVTRPTYVGGLGFGYKWDMGWMNDTLRYFARNSIHRRYHHDNITFRGLYQFTENFILPLSHDEVVHGKRSMLSKMPGDMWQQFANLRLLYTYQFTLPGKKLLFMGGEFGQWIEWRSDQSLDWHLLDYDTHRGLQTLVRDLNHLYSSKPELHALDCSSDGFSWIDCNDHEQSILCYMRMAPGSDRPVIACLNFTPVVRHDYRVGVPRGGYWQEIFNSDATEYGGSGVGNYGGVHSQNHACHGHGQSLSLTLPPLGAVILQPT